MHLTKRVRILLVNPKTPPSYWGGQESTWFVGCRAAHIPLPLITLAALLPSDWEMRLVDENVQKLRDTDLVWADTVLLTGMIIQKESLSRVISRCNALCKPTVVGGPFVSSSPEATELRGATSLVIGEAEDPELLAQFIADVSSGMLRPRYTASGMPDMNLSPVPRFDLLKRGAYTALSVQTSRGCPYNCEFCNVRMLYGRHPRYKTPEQIVSELQAIRATGYRGSIFFVDDNFIGNKGAARRILEAVERWQTAHGRPFQFYTEADIRLAEEDELVELMVRAGFFAVFQGFESPSKESLKGAAKLHNLKIDPVLATRKLRKKGLLVYGGFIVGFDADGPDIFERIHQMIDDCRIDIAMAGLLVAVPGTPLAERLHREGRLLDEYVGDQFSEANIVPKRMTRLELLRGYAVLLQKLYAPEQFFGRALNSLKEWKRTVKHRVSFQELLAVPRSFIRQGLFSSYRFQYWRFMIRAFLSDPRKIGRAITIAVQGHHFFLYTERVVLPKLLAAAARIERLQTAT